MFVNRLAVLNRTAVVSRRRFLITRPRRTTLVARNPKSVFLTDTDRRFTVFRSRYRRKDRVKTCYSDDSFTQTFFRYIRLKFSCQIPIVSSGVSHVSKPTRNCTSTPKGSKSKDKTFVRNHKNILYDQTTEQRIFFKKLQNKTNCTQLNE